MAEQEENEKPSEPNNRLVTDVELDQNWDSQNLSEKSERVRSLRLEMLKQMGLEETN